MSGSVKDDVTALWLSDLLASDPVGAPRAYIDRVREALTGATLADAGVFDMAQVKRLVDQHQSGLRDHGPAIWSLVMFESFLRQVHGRSRVMPRVQPPSYAEAAG